MAARKKTNNQINKDFLIGLAVISVAAYLIYQLLVGYINNQFEELSATQNSVEIPIIKTVSPTQ